MTANPLHPGLFQEKLKHPNDMNVEGGDVVEWMNDLKLKIKY